MLQTFRRTHFTNTLKSNLNKKKKNDHRSFNIFPKKIFRRRCEKFTSSGPVTSNRYTSFEQNWTILISPRETKNSLESKNSAHSARQSSPSSHETAEKKAIHPKISSFLLTCSNLRRVFLRSIFSSFLFFFFFFVVSMQLLRFTATIVPHFARSHATRPAVRTVNNFESAREAHEGEGSIFEPFLRRRCFSPGGTRRMERCANGDARNRKFFGCSAGESVEFVDRGFASNIFVPRMLIST